MTPGIFYQNKDFIMYVRKEKKIFSNKWLIGQTYCTGNIPIVKFDAHIKWVFLSIIFLYWIALILAKAVVGND